MAFNLDDYETVEERLQRALEAHEDMRVVTINHTTPEDRASHVWVVESRVYLNAGDQANDLPKGTGWAFEIDGQNGPANKFSALENAETSSLGRCLKHAFGAKSVTRQEMEKVDRGVSPRDWMAEASRLTSKDKVRALYLDAQAGGASKQTLEELKQYAEGLRSESERAGSSGGSSSGGKG
jgi:hypothetical protein